MHTHSSRLIKALAGGVLISIVTMGGCAKKITITQYPVFYDSSIQAVAVTPFRNLTNRRNAGNVISDKFGALLMANGTYRVYNRNDHGVLSDERDLALGLGQDPEKVEAMFRNLGDVQAVLTGAVSTYSVTSNSQRRRKPIYRYNKYTKQHDIIGYRPYTYTRNEANVTATAALLRRDGSTIYSTPVPASAMRFSEGSPPRRDPYALLASASDAVAFQLLDQFAIVRKTIKVDPGKALQMASELFEGKWTYVNRFSRQDDEMFVVVALPNVCDRNRFEIRIVRKDQRDYLATKGIVWDGKFRSWGYRFSPKQIAAKGGGAGTYTAKFFSGPSPVLTRDFQLY